MLHTSENFAITIIRTNPAASPSEYSQQAKSPLHHQRRFKWQLAADACKDRFSRSLVTAGPLSHTPILLRSNNPTRATATKYEDICVARAKRDED